MKHVHIHILCHAIVVGSSVGLDLEHVRRSDSINSRFCSTRFLLPIQLPDGEVEGEGEGDPGEVG